jgi:hypothetical protein
MTVARNLYSDISSIVNTIYEDVVFVARDNMIMPGLVNVFTDKMGAAVRDLERYGTAAINTIGEDDDLVSQQFKPSSIATLTPAEVGAQFALTDYRVESDPFGVVQDARMELGMALARNVDENLLGNFNAFTAGTIGTTGSAFTWGYFFAMQAVLRQANAPLPYVLVCTPHQAYQLGKAASVGATVTNAPSLQDQLAQGQKRAYQGNFYGVDVFTSSYCEASSTDAYAGMFSRQALALDWRRAPRIEAERDASRRLTELNLSAVYAHGVWRSEWGVAGLFTNAAVTGV